MTGFGAGAYWCCRVCEMCSGLGSKLVSTIEFTGRACRLPGAQNAEGFAGLIFSNRDAVSEVPRARWAHEAFYHPTVGTRGKSYSFAAGVLDDIYGFDPAVFGISPREAGQMDPQQRILLQVVWESIEDAGLIPADLAGKNVGVYVGTSALDHSARLSHDFDIADAYMMTGNTLSLVSNRLSHALDLRGPCLTVDTACSSSLFALDLAEKALRAGVIDMAIVGGVNLLLNPISFVGFSAARMLSQRGRCQPFAANADGYVRAEGAVAFVLERRTLGAPNPRASYGRLLASGTNTDGNTVNVALPSLHGQLSLLRAIYETAGIDPNDLAFVEAHGTGTLAGDPVEAGALGQALGQRRHTPLPIGSVKSNIGHLEPASGLAGVLKTLFALERGILPASLHADQLNPAIPFGDLNLTVATRNLHLPLSDRRLCAGVSSFGFGGANAHAVIQAPDPQLTVPAESGQDCILFLSAHCQDALASLTAQHQARFAKGASANETASQTLAFRGTYPHRVAVVPGADTVPDVLAAHVAGTRRAGVLTARTTLTDLAPVFLYSGNGSQYAGMTRAALAADADYAGHLHQIDAKFAAIAGWSLMDQINSTTLEQDLARSETAQPLLFADQIALTHALAARGMIPAAVLGHSGGEVAAACASGALDLDQALLLIHRRSQSQARLAGRGTMAALQVSESEALLGIEESGIADVTIAAVNSPRSVSIVGPVDAIEAFQRFARRAKRWACVRLAINYPYHGPAQDEIEGELRAAIAFLVPHATTIPFLSSVQGGVLQGKDLGPDYWWSNVRQPVRFQQAIGAAVAMGHRAFVEIGPSPVLNSYTTDSLGDDAVSCAVTHSFEKADSAAVNPVLRSIARARVSGVRVDPRRLAPVPAALNRELPTYPWANQPFRIDDSASIHRYYGTNDAHHLLLGREDGLDASVWKAEIDLGLIPPLGDHRVGGNALLPATAFAETALAAAYRALGAPAELRDLDITAPLPLSLGGMTELRTTASPRHGSVQIASRLKAAESGWRDHLACRYGPMPATSVPQIAPDRARHPDDVPGAALYAMTREIGLDYGPAFAHVSHCRVTAPDRVEVILSEGPSMFGASGFCLDPIGADAVFHGLVVALADSAHARARMGFVPVHIARLCVHQSGRAIRSGRIHVKRIGQRTVLADFACFDSDGVEVAHLQGVRFQSLRLTKDLQLTAHAFRWEAHRIDRSPVPAPDLAAIADKIAIAAQADDMAPQDDMALLIEAAAQRMAYDAVRIMADPAGRLAHPASAYGTNLLFMLARTGLAENGADGWQIAPDNPAPPVDQIVSGFLTGRPDLVPEFAALMRLQSALPDLLSSADHPDAKTVFGREALENLTQGSVFAHRRQRLLCDAAQAFTDAHPRTRNLRVAVAGSALTATLIRTLAHPGLEVIEITATPVTGAVVQVEPTARALADHGPFDLILSDDALGSLLPLSRAALAPQGLLLAVETAPSDFADLVFGLDPDWFAASPSPEFPLSSQRSGDEWANALTATGLVNVRTTLPDGLGNATLLVAGTGEQTVSPAVAQSNAAILTLLSGVPSVNTALGLRQDRATGIASLTLDNATLLHIPTPAPGTDPRDLLQARLLFLAPLLAEQAACAVPILAVIPAGSGFAGVPSPDQAAIWAFLRTARNEYPGRRLHALDVSPDMGDDDLAARIADLLAGGTTETELIIGPDGLTALRVRQGLAQGVAPDDGTEKRLLSPALSGRLDDLHWQSAPRPAPAGDEVEIAVAYTGINYRDVMWAMGVLPEEALETGFAGPTLGIECAGTVLRVGAGVTHLSPGDPVVTFGPACFASHVTVRADFVGRVPQGADLAAAATMPVAFFTAFYALDHLARLSPGETVLIHGAAGGVGLAAVQIAQRAGARIIATAGSAVKRDLLRALGVTDVLDSRTLDFADQVRALTGGSGVDVVLNSLAGDAMERSLNSLAPFGRFLELGKQDYYGNTTIGLRPLKENISYFGVDVDQLLSVKPDLAQRLYRQMMTLFSDGQLTPLPYRSFGGGQVVDAFRLMQKSGHVGKIVVQPATVAQRTDAPFAASANGAHLVIGGTGGLGLAVAEWLAQRGAQTIILIGRSAPDPAACDRIDALIARGVSVRHVACDVADSADLARALDRIRATAPIKGVIHSAMVLEDMPIAALTADSLRRTLAAKVSGAANLDALTTHDALDYFVMFSSIATLIGNHGQSAYVAANGYLEGLARRRHAAGLPALTVGWGPITDAGYLSRDKAKATLVNRFAGNVEFTARQALAALDRLMAQALPDPVIHVTPMRWTATVEALKSLSAPTYRAVARLGQTTDGDAHSDDLRAVLQTLPAPDAETRLTRFLAQKIAHILHIPEKALDVARPVTELGMDSLMGVELGLTMQQSLGDDIPIAAISEALSVREIARGVVRHIQTASSAAPVDAVMENLLAQHRAPLRTEAAE